MSAPTPASPPPLRHSYWVIPGLLLAGEHPSGDTREKTRERLKKLVGAGIECFVDLTKPTELDRYDLHLPSHVQYARKPIKDHGVPASREQMVEILEHISMAVRAGKPVYVHCRAGIGRTGTVVGCLLVEQGFAGEHALDELNRLWQQCRRSKSWPSIPETESQARYVREWVKSLEGALAWPVASVPGVSVAPHGLARPETGVQAHGVVEPMEPDPLLDPDTLAAAGGLRERFLGTLLGLAVGDAVAAATQFRRTGTFTPVGDLIGGGPFDLPRGAWSDDTAMTLCLAESLLERGGFDPRDQIERYARWQEEGYLSSTGQCFGITANTARALALAKWRRVVFPGSHDPKQTDPEPLSRVAAAALFFFPDHEETALQSAESARATCQAPAVLQACRQLGRALNLALTGQPKTRIVAEGPPVPESFASSTATAPAVLAAAFWAFATTDNFRDAVLRAANVGGNSDVVASVCGQLAGAYYRVSSIPATWRNALMRKDLIEDFADRLLAHGLVRLSA
jgi:ADP-ribosyl-[dinitrogen reductase] hydrolase